MTDNGISEDTSHLADCEYTSTQVCAALEQWVTRHYSEDKRRTIHHWSPIFAAAEKQHDCVAWYTSLDYYQRRDLVRAYDYVVCDELLYMLPIVIAIGFQKNQYIELSLVNMTKSWTLDQVNATFNKLLSLNDEDVTRAVEYIKSAFLSIEHELTEQQKRERVLAAFFQLDNESEPSTPETPKTLGELAPRYKGSLPADWEVGTRLVRRSLSLIEMLTGSDVIEITAINAENRTMTLKRFEGGREIIEDVPLTHWSRYKFWTD